MHFVEKYLCSRIRTTVKIYLKRGRVGGWGERSHIFLGINEAFHIFLTIDCSPYYLQLSFLPSFLPFSIFLNPFLLYYNLNTNTNTIFYTTIISYLYYICVDDDDDDDINYYTVGIHYLTTCIKIIINPSPRRIYFFFFLSVCVCVCVLFFFIFIKIFFNLLDVKRFSIDGLSI